MRVSDQLFDFKVSGDDAGTDVVPERKYGTVRKRERLGHDDRQFYRCCGR
jgi:hypothetical protein